MDEIYIEGMDCSGKSATIDLLMEKGIVNYRRHRTLIDDNPKIKTFRTLKKTYTWDSEEVCTALIEAIEYDLDNYRISDGNGILVQESNLILKGYSMLLANSKKCNYKIMTRLEELLELYPMPKKSIFMTANEAARKDRLAKRIKTRGMISENDSLILNDYKRFCLIEKNMEKLMIDRFDAFVLDTSFISVEKTAKLIIQYLNDTIII